MAGGSCAVPVRAGVRTEGAMAGVASVDVSLDENVSACVRVGVVVACTSTCACALAGAGVPTLPPLPTDADANVVLRCTPTESIVLVLARGAASGVVPPTRAGMAVVSGVVADAAVVDAAVVDAAVLRVPFPFPAVPTLAFVCAGRYIVSSIATAAAASTCADSGMIVQCAA